MKPEHCACRTKPVRPECAAHEIPAAFSSKCDFASEALASRLRAPRQRAAVDALGAASLLGDGG
jgi:hypothetical protein